jgi:MYXO-CTERM domain-containing protein
MEFQAQRHWLVRIFAGCLVLFFCQSVWAYDYNKDSKGNPLKWAANTPIQWYLNVSAFKGIPQNQVVATFQKAFQTWSSVRCAKLNFAFRGITTTGAALLADKKNVIVFKPKLSNIFEINIKWDNKKNVLLDIDVEIDASYKWSLNPQQNEYDLESLAMMIVGSLIGLTNSKVNDATMFNSFGAMSMVKRTLDKDDMDGACFLYPSGQKEQCLNPSDCPTNTTYACTSKKCVLTTPPKSPQVCNACKTNSDCGSGLLCTTLGVGKVCLQRCSEDNLCPKDHICNGNGTNSECLPNSGVCPAAKCTKDSDCQANYECKAGACKPKPISGCLRDGDCPGVQKFCVNNKCVECKDGSTQKCTCNDGSDSTQSCTNNAWDACKCNNPPVCKTGDTQACKCLDGKSGNRTCDAKGFWGQCECKTNPTTCTAGDSKACQCTNGKAGVQKCKTDGSGYEACVCNPGSQICTPGGTQVCTCVSGKSGAQTCDASGQAWGACQCQACTPGSTQSCVCPGGQGSQICASSGQAWGACQCGSTPAPKEPSNGDGGTTKEDSSNNKTCKISASCAAGEECLRGVCTPKQGCACSTQDSTPLQGLLWLSGLVLLFGFRRRQKSARKESLQG